MTITYKGVCPCEDFDFTLRYTSPTEEAVTIFCPFCGVEIEEKSKDDMDDDDSYYDDE